MIKEKIEGKWIGNFVYGKGYSEEYRGKSIPFIIEIFFEDNNFKGTCIDDLTKAYFDKPASIEGTFQSNYISFIKRYPYLLTAGENNKPLAVPGQPSPDIHYTGLLSRGLFSKSYKFRGEWSLTNSFVDESGKKQFYSFYGTWSMKK